jgi:CRP-like cAMP-binding protein
MDPAALRDILGQLPHFRGLPDEVMQAVVGTASELNLSSGDDVFREGEPCSGFFVVAEGRVKIYRLREDGREQVVDDVGPGSTFAEAALFHRGRFPAYAAATETPTRLVKLDGTGFLRLFASDPRLAKSMVGSLCSWLHTLLERIETLSIVSAGARLAHHLLRLPARQDGETMVITLPIAKKDLASELSVTPETLSRLLSRWKSQGWIEVDAARVTLLKPAAIEALADTGSS